MKKLITTIIAEAGVNHNGSIDTAKRMIDVAADAGADIVKFQTFQAEKLVTKKAEKTNYQKNLTDNKESQYEMIKKCEFSVKTRWFPIPRSCLHSHELTTQLVRGA